MSFFFYLSMILIKSTHLFVFQIPVFSLKASDLSIFPLMFHVKNGPLLL